MTKNRYFHVNYQALKCTQRCEKIISIINWKLENRLILLSHICTLQYILKQNVLLLYQCFSFKQENLTYIGLPLLFTEALSLGLGKAVKFLALGCILLGGGGGGRIAVSSLLWANWLSLIFTEDNELIFLLNMTT